MENTHCNCKENLRIKINEDFVSEKVLILNHCNNLINKYSKIKIEQSKELETLTDKIKELKDFRCLLSSCDNPFELLNKGKENILFLRILNNK